MNPDDATPRLGVNTFFSSFATWVARWTGSQWTLLIAAAGVAVCLALFGADRTNIGISIVTLLMLFILQNTQNRDAAALNLKLDELITHLQGPDDELAGIESKTRDEIEELRTTGDGPPSAIAPRDHVHRPSKSDGFERSATPVRPVEREPPSASGKPPTADGPRAGRWLPVSPRG